MVHSSGTMRLPCQVADAEIKAEFKNGVLAVTLPKSPEVKAKTTKITVRHISVQSAFSLPRPSLDGRVLLSGNDTVLEASSWFSAGVVEW